MKVIIPEVIEPDERLPRDLVALRKFSVLMDQAVGIPGTGRRIGLDAGLGFIPGIGDAVAALLSTWIIIGALRHRVPFLHIVRMVINVLIDLVLGEVPLLGDLFDIVFEENVMNMRLLMRHRDRSKPPRSFFRIAFGAFLVVSIIGFAALGLVFATVVAAVWIANQR